MLTGAISDSAASVARLMSAVVASRVTTIKLDIAGATAAAWDEGDPEGGPGTEYLMRQATSIGGGTTEMARNNISERLLGMPRERTLDKDVPFREVPKGPGGT
jgi:alkylation response protein AidB-like acyl-CoA dehydrogenase